MFEPTTSKRNERRAVILLVVITLLTLFAVLGLAFVFYAQSQADASRFYREAQAPSVASTGVPVPATVLFDDFLRQLLYDLPDDSTGAPSALRGHSLARLVWGYNSTGLPGSAVNTEYQNVKAFAGLGRLHTGSETYGSVTLTDDFLYPNYTYFSADGFVRDPERIGSRANPNAAQTTNPFVGGFNPPYTYPDLNNMFLGAIRASDGAVLMPSYHRPWLVGSYAAGGAAWTSAAGKYQILTPRPADMAAGFPTPTAGGYVKNLAGSPGYLVDASTGTYDNNDSYWINIGAPIITLPDGTLVQPLFAPLIVDLDNRVNLNVHGNVRGKTTDPVTSTQVAMHVSNQGWGPWEVNLSKILMADAAANGGVPVEWANIFQGNSTTHVVGKYGANQQPGAGGVYTAAGDATHFYGQVDYDGCNELNGYTQTTQMSLPTTLTPFPTFPQGYENGSGSAGPMPPERLNYPGVYNYFQPSGDDTLLAHSNMGGLIYDLSTNVSLKGSIVGQLCPTNFTDATNGKRIRQLVTTISFDVDRSGLSPWLNTTLTSPPPTAYGYTAPYTNPFQAPGGPAISFPQLSAYPGYAGTPANATPEFSPDWRGANALDAQGLVSQVLSRVDLDRFLPSYPHIASGVNGSQPNGPALVAYNARYDDTSVSGWQAIQAQYLAAQSARQQLAADIYTRLAAVTGVTIPNTDSAAPTDQELQPLRWLAQLAVNIVDFIDEDDISTPFNFYPESILSTTPTNNQDPYPPATPRTSSKYWVFGTELPRIVLNEALGESTPPVGGTGNSTNNVWVELYNPYPYTNYPPASPANPPPANTQQADGSAVVLYVPQAGGQSFDSNAQFPPVSGKSPGYAPYHISIVDGTSNWPINNTPTANPTATLNDNAIGMVPDGASPPNPLATPPTRSETPDTDFQNAVNNVDGTPQNGPPNNYPSPSVPPGTFFLIGPSATTFNNAIKAVANGGTVPNATPFLSSSTGMTYPVAYSGGTPTPNDTNATGVYVLLRRLANPHMPWDPNAMIPNVNNPGTFIVNPYFNPYVTTDFIQPVTIWNTSTNPTDSSQGKMQPYAGYYNANPALSQLRTQVGLGGAPTQHTFGAVNNPAPAGGAYDWLTFPDRQLISPMELLMVSGYYPHELTQQFITSDGTANVLKHQHLVPWFDNFRRLYRFFEFAETSSRAAGVPVGARIPGKININTIWDPQTLVALCDGEPGNHFTDAKIYNSANPADPTTVWGKLLAQRTPYLAAPVAGQGAIGQNDQPFRSLAAGYSLGSGGTPPDTQYPGGAGIQNTILGPMSTAAIPSTARTDFFSIAGQTHPYFTNELLTKAFNNLTTRSNTFALWLTVGFFTIPNPANPTQLGAEYTGGTGVPTRHQLFAVIDRSALTLYPTANDPVTVQSTPNSSVQVLGSNTIGITGATPTWTLNLGAQTSGTFTLSYGGQTTAALPYNATASQIQTALGSLSTVGATNVVVSGGNPYTIVLAQNLTAALTANLTTLSAPGNSSLTQAPAPLWNLFLGEQTPLTGATQPSTGAVPGVNNFTLTYGGKTTSPLVCGTAVGSTGAQLAVSPTAAQVQSALSSLSSVGVGNVTVSGPNGGPFSITFAQSLTGVLTGNFTTLANPGNAFLSQLPIDPNLSPPGPIQPGSILTVDWSGNGNSNMETVQVTGVNASPPSFTAVFNKTHAGPFSIYALRFGNPGPQPQFQHLDNGAVVVYYLPVY